MWEKEGEGGEGGKRQGQKEERERAKKRFQASGFSPPSTAIEFFILVPDSVIAQRKNLKVS